jgi:hypothetical protein
MNDLQLQHIKQERDLWIYVTQDIKLLSHQASVGNIFQS